MEKTPYDIELEVERYHWWFVVRRGILKLLLSSVNLPLDGATIDIGCGIGSNLKILSSERLNVIGLDRSFYALSLAQKELRYPLINGDLSKLPLRSNSVGSIVAMDVIEHLEDDANGISELYCSLKSGGILILTVPAFKSLWGIQDVVTGHKRRYSRRDISSKLVKAGFEVLRSSYFNFFLFFPIFLARNVIHLLGLKIESENKINSPFVNFLLKSIFSLEPYILKYFSFPFGVSIFCIARK